MNNLPLRHRLAVDHTLDGAGKDIPEVRSVIHLHGGHVASSSDGNPEDWITPGHTQHTVYPNNQPAATLWYHDHSMGITRLNAIMGLAGLYLIRDPDEDRLRLPSGPYDIPLVLQDRIFDAHGQLAYPVGPAGDSAPGFPNFTEQLCWSTAACGPTSMWSLAAIASVSSTPRTRAFISYRFCPGSR